MVPRVVWRGCNNARPEHRQEGRPMSKLLKKYDLPSCAPLDGLEFNVQKLRDELLGLEDSFVSVYESNKEFCANNHHLANQVYSHFEQISLTEFQSDATIPTAKECESLAADPTGGSATRSRLESYRLKLKGNVKPELIERNYTKPTDLYSGSYFQECANRFLSKPTRVRLVRLNPGQVLPAHIDYDPSYAVRVLVPIVTNDRCINMVWRKGVPESYYIPADGRPYFLNVGFAHGVANFGEKPRYTLMISLDGQEDIQSLSVR